MAASAEMDVERSLTDIAELLNRSILPVKLKYLQPRPPAEESASAPGDVDMATEAKVASTDTVSTGPEGEDIEEKTEETKSGRKRKKRRLGQNKKRKMWKTPHTAFKMCHRVGQGLDCNYGDTCKFSHDVAAYLVAKHKDLGTSCYLYDTTGNCKYGYHCRFAGAHLDENTKLLTKEISDETKAKNPPALNLLDRKAQTLLRRFKYPFPKAKSVIKEYEKFRKVHKAYKQRTHTKLQREHSQAAKDRQSSAPTPSTTMPTPTEAPTITRGKAGDKTEDERCLSLSIEVAADGTVSTIIKVAAKPDNEPREPVKGSPETVFAMTRELADEEEPFMGLAPLDRRPLDLKGKVYVAPLTTVGNLPFRRVCVNMGADVTCGEMATVANLLKGQQSEWALIKRHKSEKIFGVQIAAGWVDVAARCSELMSTSELSVDFVDLNVGCPIDAINNKGMGSVLMKTNNQHRLTSVVRTMTTLLKVPVAVKLRMGWDVPNFTSLVKPLYDCGASWLSLHGRTRKQRYTKRAHWDYIGEAATECSRVGIPLVGNGDIYTPMQWEKAMESGVTTCMLARGVLEKPWLCTEIKERKLWDISSGERLQIIRDFTNYGLEHWGSDTSGVDQTRNYLLQWLSFLCRYTPVGLLERQVAPALNLKPPSRVVGRDDLETLMLSRYVGDWIKISELVLGPAPEGFTFTPKHRANAYEDQ